MADIDNDFQLLLAINRAIVRQISDSVIIQLKELTDKNFLLSGDDSGLINVWEEICAQVQNEYAYSWEAYQETIESFAIAELAKQPNSFKILISYIEGVEGDFENEKDEYQYKEENAVREIVGSIIDKAGDYRNDNIIRFLDQDYEEDEPDEEDVKIE